MRSCTVIVALIGAAEAGRVTTNIQHTMLRVNSTNDHKYGNKACPCIGLDGLDGSTEVVLADGSKKDYPADLGGRCEAWDATRHPSCPGKDFCEQKWCYVDPCNCADVSVLPKPSVYVPDSKYHGRAVHFSYVTCDSKDTYTGKEDDNRQTWTKDIEQTCSKTPDALRWGDENCRCIGMYPQSGVTKVTIDGKQMDFPADTGSTCDLWDAKHPECSKASPPEWCSQKWCYVDPCSCRLPTPPKTTAYLPEANYQGKRIYYSYETCGAKDAYTGSGIHQTACVNQKKKDECTKLEKCAWTGKECLGKELVEVCHSGASTLTSVMALALSLLALVK